MPSNCQHIALSPNVHYVELVTCCTALQIIQPSPSTALSHPKLAGKDPEVLPTHVGVMQSGVTSNSLHWILM